MFNNTNLEEIQFFNQDLKNTTPWFIDVTAERRNDLMNFLKINSIGSRVMYPPINKQKAYDLAGEHYISNIIGKNGLWLPSSSKLSDNQIDYISDKIKEFYL